MRKKIQIRLFNKLFWHIVIIKVFFLIDISMGRAALWKIAILLKIGIFQILPQCRLTIKWEVQLEKKLSKYPHMKAQ